MLHMLAQNECPVRSYACLCVCCNTAPKVSDCPQPNSHNLFWVLPELVMDQSYAVCMLYCMYCIKVIEYHWNTPAYPSITPSLYCQYFPIEIRSAPFKTSNRNRQWRNFETFSLIDLFAHVYVLCVCVSVSPSLSAPTLSLSFTISNRSEVPRKTVFWSNVSFPSSAPTSFVDIVNLTQNTLAKAFTNYDLIACCLNPTTTTATTRRVTTKKNNKLEEIISDLSGRENTL